MAAKMSLCTISYNYEHYAGIDVEKLSNLIYEYVKKEFAVFNPQVSEPGSDMEIPDHVDVLLSKKDGSIFYESDILRRAINIPHDCQYDGLVLEIFIQNCDGTRYKKRHEYPKPWWKHQAKKRRRSKRSRMRKTLSTSKRMIAASETRSSWRNRKSAVASIVAKSSRHPKSPTMFQMVSQLPFALTATSTP